MKLTPSEFRLIGDSVCFGVEGIPNLDPFTLIDSIVEITGETYKVLEVHSYNISDPIGHRFAIRTQRQD